MFRAYGVNGPPVTSCSTNNNGSGGGSGHQSGSGKDTSSLFFNQIENNLRSWHSTNYCVAPPLAPPAKSSPRHGAGHATAASSFPESDFSQLNRPLSLTSSLSQQQQQAHEDYDNVLRMMMSTATIGVEKARTTTNQNRSNGNLFNKFYGWSFDKLTLQPSIDLVGARLAKIAF